MRPARLRLCVKRWQREAWQAGELVDAKVEHDPHEYVHGRSPDSAGIEAPLLDGAQRFVIESVTREVPIWKRETFEGGSVWIEGPGEAPTG